MQSVHRKWFGGINVTQDKFAHLCICGYFVRSPLPGPEHKGAADAGGKAEGAGGGHRHPRERSRGLAEVQPQVLTVQGVMVAPVKARRADGSHRVAPVAAQGADGIFS